MCCHISKQIYTCRVRLGYAHVANNRYEKWLMYAIGGSANPTIFSEGNYFLASKSTQVSHIFFFFFYAIV